MVDHTLYENDVISLRRKQSKFHRIIQNAIVVSRINTGSVSEQDEANSVS